MGDVRSATPLTRGAFVIAAAAAVASPLSNNAPELDRLFSLFAGLVFLWAEVLFVEWVFVVVVVAVVVVLLVESLGELLLAVLVLPVRPLFRVIARLCLSFYTIGCGAGAGGLQWSCSKRRQIQTAFSLVAEYCKCVYLSRVGCVVWANLSMYISLI